MRVLLCKPVHLLDMFSMRFLRLLLNLLLYNQHSSLTTLLRYHHWQNHIGVKYSTSQPFIFYFTYLRVKHCKVSVS
uniref:OVA5 n=1 Tax=Arundo donax TaxID=35708 RepID=A0A0A9P3Y9_ARUDO